MKYKRGKRKFGKKYSKKTWKSRQRRPAVKRSTMKNFRRNFMKMQQIHFVDIPVAVFDVGVWADSMMNTANA